MTEFILLTDGDDQHSKLGGSSKASHDSAKSRLAKPGVPNFHLTLLYVGQGAGETRRWCRPLQAEAVLRISRIHTPVLD